MTHDADHNPIPAPNPGGPSTGAPPSENGARPPTPAEGLPEWNLEPPPNLLRRHPS